MLRSEKESMKKMLGLGERQEDIKRRGERWIRMEREIERE